MRQIHASRIDPASFSRFGNVAALDSQTPTAEGPGFTYWSDLAHYLIDGETEIGICTVVTQTDPVVSWMERHDVTPEILVPIDAPFVLPVMTGDGSDEVLAFEVQPGEAVAIGSGVWHSACIPVESDEASYFVLFRRGTPHQDVVKTDIDEVRICTST